MARRTPFYAPKAALAAAIAAAQAELAGGEDDASVVINGKYGERGVIFFTTDDAETPVGFATLGKDHPLKDQTLNRDQAADLVAFLVSAYGFVVQTTTVTNIAVN